MSSSLPEARYELSIQQDLPPAPNFGPQCADWLPRFAGSSWLAYAASSAVVVATAASPLNPGESSSGRFFQQVLETRSSNDEDSWEGRHLVTSVGWAPVGPSVGQLAAAAGKVIHLYSPTKFAKSSTTGPISSEIPLAWETKQVLQHAFQVLTFSWTESGDGLLSAGSNITMWKRGEAGVSVLWQVRPTVPQAYAASSWSSAGLVATGDGIAETQANSIPEEECIVDEKTTNSSMGKATVWWWQEGQEIQGIELQHPSEVSMIQWRPSNGSGEDPYTYRPVLLTSSRDGSVRLWLDMEGPSYSSFCFGDSHELKKKPTYTMAAVVDVNTCLNGVLGHDIFVTWASESRTGGSSEEKRNTSRNSYARKRDMAPCEWLLGVGPRGKVALWSIHSLDDILPTRSPRVTLWQQGDDVLSQPSTLYPLRGDGDSHATDRLMMKAVVQRPEGTLAVAPSSLDLFEALPSGHFRWSRLWPPVSAIGTGGGHVGSGAQTTRNKSAWGVSSEVVHLDGHRGAIVQVALHPSPTVALAASVDNQGVVLLWDLSAWASPQVKVMSSQTLGWKLAGQISGPQNSTPSSYHGIAWAPSSLPEGRSILLAGDMLKIDCFLVGRSDSQRKSDSSILSDHLYRLDCPVFSGGDRLHALSAIPMPSNAFEQVAEERSFLILGTDNGGGILASWAVQLQVTAPSDSSQDGKVAAVGVQDGMELEGEGSLSTSDSKFQDLEKSGYTLYAGSLVSQERIYIKDSLIESVNFDGGQRVTSIAVVSGSIKGSMSTHLEVYEKAHLYDVLTGCADGSVRLYKVYSSQPRASHSVISQTGSCFWQCIGVVRAHTSPVIITATTATGEKIASVGDAEHDKTVRIWEVDSCNESGEFELEGQITLPQTIVALSWINAGMGCVLLSVATKYDLFIFVQDRPSSQKEVSRSTVWIPLASFSFNTAIDHLLWSFQGSPILSSQGHIWVFSPWVCAKLKSSCRNGNINSVEGVPQPGACNSCRLLQAAEVLVSPLADYHPRALFWSLFRGDRSRARACIRHLSHHLAATTVKPAAKHNETYVSEKIDQVHSRVPRLGLAKLLQKDVSITTQASANSDSAYNTSFTFMNSPITQSRPPNVSDKYSFLNNTSWLDEFSDEFSEVKPLRSTQSQDAVKTDGSEPFSKDEMEAIVQFIEDGRSLLQLSEEELEQVLALVEVVGEMDGVRQAAQCAGLDISGQRFWLAHRYNSLLASQSGGKKGDVQGVQVESEALAWALQSDTKETLLDVCASEQSLWPELRALGVGFWFTDAVPLRKKMEKVARLQFMASRDAKDSSLLYIALERRTVLAGLFKISKDERDRPLVDFMARDFREEKHKAAALKNAYVLMGKHRYELAAAFFLLGGDIDSAVSVCTKNLEDPQLGLVVCRLVEGSDGPIGRKLISKSVLPGALRAEDYWLASLCQWLLGNGIETMHEVISGCQPSESMQEKTTEIMRTSSSIPLYPGVADYCAVLVLKPRLLREPRREKVTAISKQATLRASLALRKIGLPLQALELMADSSGVKTITENGHEVSPINMGFNPDLMEYSESQDIIRANWLLPELVADVHELAKQNLALECMSQLVQEYSDWAVALLSSSSRLSDIHEGIESSSCIEVGSATAEEAEKKIEEGIEALKSTFSLDGSGIVSGVVTWALNHHRLYVYYRLLLAQHAGFKYPGQKFSLSSGVGLSLKSDILGPVWKEAPWALARMILACGGSVFSFANGTSKSPTWKSMMPREQIEELVRYGGELQKLASVLSGYSGSTENRPNENLAAVGNEDMKKKTQRAMILLAFVYYVSAAWLGKNGKALVALIGPTISDPTKAPEVPKTNISVKWFQDLCSQSEEQNSLTRLAASGDPSAPVLPEEEVWRVTGVALWVHMVAYIKKQLAGTGKDTGYSGFGRVSVPQAPSKSSINLPSTSAVSPAQVPSTSSSRLVATFMGLGIQSTSSTPSTTWSEIKNKMRDDSQALTNISSGSSVQDVVRVAESPRSSRNYGDLYLSLLSSLGCIASGLQQQLAAHLQYLLEVKGNSDPLVIWLWGKHSDVKIEGTNSPKVGTSANKPASAGDGRQQFPVVYPEIQLGGDDESSKELWRLLVVRESVRSTLAMEGVIGPTSTTIRVKQGDWREARRRSALSATEIDGHALTASPIKTGRIADKALTVGATPESEGSEGRYVPEFQKPEVMFSLSGELIEAFCINSCNPDQVVLATNRKGLMYLDLHTRGPFTETSESMLEQGDWHRSSWAGAVSTPGSSLKTQRSSSLGGPAAGATLKSGKEAVKAGGVSFGMPGYGGMGAWGGWEDWDDNDSVVDPIATIDNVRTKTLAAHPSQPIFLVGSNNTHVYLWEYGKPSATATYGVLPAANMPPPYVIPSVATVRFDSGGHRFVTAAMDGTVSTWQLEVGGRSNVRPTESCLFFGTHASDATFIVGSSSLVAATGMTNTGNNLIAWDTLAPPSSNRQSISCHEGGARCIASLDVGVGGSSSSPWIVSGGKGGDIAVHDFRYILAKKGKRPQSPLSSSSKNGVDEAGKNGMLWHVPKAHAGSVTKATAVPGTPYFFTGSKDGDIKLWDVSTRSMVGHWQKVHERHTFLQVNTRSLGSIIQQAAVTDVQPTVDGFLSCGGDGTCKLFKHQ